MPGMRPRKATCGWAARRMSSRSETTTATITPLRMPSSSTAAKATIETLNSKRLTRQTWRSSPTSISPLTATSTMAASTTLGRLASIPVRYIRHRPIVDRGEDQRERRPGAGLVVHRGLRQAAGHRVGLEERRRQVRRAQAEQLLARVDLVAVRLRQRAGRGDALHVRQQHAGERQRDHPVHVAQPQPRHVEVGQALRQRADDLEPEVSQRRHRQHDDGDHHHEQRDRAARQEFLPQQQHRQRGETEGQHGEVGVGELAPQDGDALEEAFPAPLDPEQLGQLGHGDRQRRAGLEAEQDGLADEVDERAQPQEPRQRAHAGDDQRGQRRDVGPPSPDRPPPCPRR